VTQAKLVRRRKWTDELGNLYGIVLWRVKQAPGIRKVSATGSRSSAQVREHPLCFTTIITPRVTIDTWKCARIPTIL